MDRHQGLRRVFRGSLAAVTLVQILAVATVPPLARLVGFGVTIAGLAILDIALAAVAWRLITIRISALDDSCRREAATLRAQCRSEVASHQAVASATSCAHERAGRALATFRDDGAAGLTAAKAAAESLAGISDDMSRAALRISSETMAVSVAAEDADRQIAKVVAAGEEFLETIAHIGENASRSAEMGVEVFNLTQSSTQTIAELTTASEKIGTMTALISGIANQTNLLALNATIEAARAGEQGRGFAVVAGEVKNLAKETGKAVALIAEMVETIRGSSERASAAMSATAASIGSLNQATANIAAAVEERVAAASLMAQSVAKAASNVTFVKSTLGNIEAAVDEAIQGAGFLRAAATEIVDQTSGVREHLERSVALVASPAAHPAVPPPTEAWEYAS